MFRKQCNAARELVLPLAEVTRDWARILHKDMKRVTAKTDVYHNLECCLSCLP